MDALDPALRSNANVGDAATDTTVKSQQQLPLPLPSWHSHAQPHTNTNTQPQQHHQGPNTHDPTTTTFSPQTPNSTTPAATPSTAITTHDHHHTNNTAASTPSSTHHNTHPGSFNPSSLTPPGTGSLADPHHTSTPGHDPGTDPKKPRACESCRSLKVRCDPVPADPDGPCRRCVKARRACVVTQPTRKRQKKTDSRVAELEKKIDALTASLVATTTTATGASKGGAGDGVAAGGWARGRQEEEEQVVSRYPPPPPTQMHTQPQLQPQLSAPAPMPMVPPPVPVSAAAAGQKRKFEERRESGEEVSGSAAAAAAAAAGRENSSSATPQPGGEMSKEQQPADVVERGLLTMALAGELLVRYTTKMCHHLPGVVLTPGTTAAELRASKPILFLAVMATASSEMPALQRTLTKELMQVFADRIIVRGHKSLELVQALHVATIWYWPPERFEELKFYQLVHVAAVMAIEIGLGRKKAARGGFRKHISHAWRDHPLRKQPPPDPTTIEARRAWLTCYFMATNTAMALHRSNLIRWTPFVAECMDVLESSPDAAPTDKYLCHLVWTHKLAEEVGIQFSMDDPASTPNLAEPRTQHALRGFERELERYRTAIPADMQQPSLKMSFHVISLYMHEVATHNDPSDDCRMNPGDTMIGSDTPLSFSHINALSACLTAIDGIFDTFLTLDVHTIRSLPVFNFVRVAYAVVVLIKLYFAASSPKSELGKVINKDHMKVEQHLHNLLEKFRATAAEDRSRPAAKFLVVLVMIRSWFQKQTQNPNGATNPGGNGPPTETPPPYPRQSGGERGSATPVPQQPQQQPDYPTTASTPLQLLSEIATNNSTNGPRPSTSADLLPSLQGTATTGPWLNRPPLLYDSTNAGTSQQPATDGTTAPYMVGVGGVPPQQQQQQQPLPSNVGIPWLSNTFLSGADLDYDYANFGDGFSQAMDLTLGGFMDGGFSTEETAMRFMMHDPGPAGSGWFPTPGMGPGMDGLGPGGGGAAGGGGGGGGFGF